MGNCVSPSLQKQHEVEEMVMYQEEHNQKEAGGDQFVEESGKKGSSLKVKVVLTKEELEWLMLQLTSDGGSKKLEDVLKEIEKCRGKAKAWRPSLESIMEEQ
ncbi:hypothetical protein Tsubulata_013764 [Turnera subulata]|uniref:Uncharacterized protein n=1 Tax=Turnera subulata TaxID=218843 RepID=A0A9Q0FEL0_9ROSI|nr:hypothetical protein Tsubulata_013764 [Turnera subulata]